MSAPFPTSCEALTPQWLTQALGGPDALGGAEVTAFTAANISEGVGFMGVVNRLSLTYDRPTAAPATIVAKFSSPEAGARQIAGTFRHYEKEVGFYADMAATTPIHAPRAYYQQYDPGSGDFALLLEDLAPRRNGDQLTGLSLDQARLAVTELGRLQARWWETPDLHATAWLPAFNDPSMLVLEDVFQQCWGPYRDFMGERLPAAMHKVGDGLSTRIRKMLHTLSQAPATLVHGDYRADNFFFGEGDASMAVVDWQIVLKGRGAFDLAYLLTGNISVEDREGDETELVQLYHSALCAGGVSGYSLQQAWADYRFCALFGWIWPVVAIGSLDPANERGLAFFYEWSRRVCAAIDDLGAADVLADY